MSNLGQAALIVVGTVVGAYFGAPQLGFVLGSLAGSVLFPTQLPRGPQMTDNRTTTATIGGPVPIVFGTADVAGTVIWLAPYVQTTNHSSAKGGPQQTTYQYNQSIAISLCEGPVGTILRIWENGTIVYDIRPQQVANTDLNLLAETDLEYANRLTVSALYAETFVFYQGTETQLADPTIESVLGMGNVPAWRGLSYIVYPNRLLQTGQAWRHPTFRFEVTAGGTGDCETVTEYSNDVLYPWNSDGTPDTRGGCRFRIIGVDVHAPAYDASIWGGVDYPTLAGALAVGSAQYGGGYEVLYSYGLPFGDGTGGSSLVGGGAAPGGNGGLAIAAQYHTPDPNETELHFNWCSPTDGIFNAPLGPSSVFATPGARFANGSAMYLITGIVNTGYPMPPPATVSPWCTTGGNEAYGYPYWWFQSGDLVINAYRTPAAPPPPCAGLTRWVVDSDYAVQSDGTLVRCTDAWVRDTNNYWVLQVYNAGGANEAIVTCKYPLNPCIPQFDPRATDAAFWEAGYAVAVASGAMPPGMTFNPAGGDTCYPKLQNFAYKIDRTICTGTAAGATVASIITAVCARAGLLTVDVADMASVSVLGYSVSAITSASAIIAPLRSVGFFDAIESQGQMHFFARGKPVVATLTTDDIGAYEETGNTVPPPSVVAVRAQDEDLPRSIRFKYKAVSRDYQDDEQDSQFRLATKAVNDVDVAVPLCMGDVQAAQCAEVLWADAWAARTSYQIAVDQSWLALDCADCIAVPVDGVIQRMRIVSDTISSGVLRKLSCVRDDAGAYISFAVPSVPQVQPQKLSFIGPATFELLDLPALVDADSDPGFYVAAQRQSGGGQWNGAMIYRSLDGGATWVELFAATNEATLGTLNAVVPASESYDWDTATTIAVNVANSTVTFESRTDDAVIAGANAAAMGADGRWEVVQFATATQVSSTQWHLSRLLRGRRGTEHVMGSSVIGDKFVLLSTGDLERVILESSQIGTALQYKAVALGAPYASGIVQTFAGHAQALVPFSPVELAATKQLNGDLVLTWIRRGRLGRTLMSGVDIPLSEATEAYSIDILSGSSPETVKRTIAATAQTATYTHAQQVTDFGTPPAPNIRIAVYQLSAIVGRGTPAIQTLTIGGALVPSLVSIAVTNPGSSSLTAAATRQFSATGTYSDASTADITSTVTWLSSAPSFATVSSTGLVTGVAAGTLNISASLGSIHSPTDALTITGSPPLATGNISGATTNLFVTVSMVDGMSGPVYTYFDSTDGVTWANRGVPTESQFPGTHLTSLALLSGHWYANQNATGWFWKSGDANWYDTPWTGHQLTVLPTASVSGGFDFPIVRYLNGQWVSWTSAGLNYEPIVTSADYVTWTDKAAPAGVPHTSTDFVGYADLVWDATHGRYLAFAIETNSGSESARLYHSTDLVTFSEIDAFNTAALAGPVGISAVAQSGADLIAVGFGTVAGVKTPMILYSADSGLTWARSATSYPGSITNGLAGAVFDGTDFVVTGTQQFGHSSDGGATWTWNDTGVALDYQMVTNGAGAIVVQSIGSSVAADVQTSTDHGATFASNFVP
jgi:hypothetical protein